MEECSAKEKEEEEALFEILAETETKKYGYRTREG